MDDQPTLSEHHLANPAAARVALHQLVQRLTDEEVTAFWRLVCSWVGSPPRRPRKEDLSYVLSKYRLNASLTTWVMVRGSRSA